MNAGQSKFRLLLRQKITSHMIQVTGNDSIIVEIGNKKVNTVFLKKYIIYFPGNIDKGCRKYFRL